MVILTNTMIKPMFKENFLINIFKLKNVMLKVYKKDVNN